MVACKGNRAAGAFLFCGDSGHHLNLEGTTLSFTYTLPFSDFFKSLDRKCRETHLCLLCHAKVLSHISSYCMQPLFTSSFIGGKIKIRYLIVFLILVTFLVAFRHAAERRHYRKQVKTLTAVFIQAHDLRTD